LTDRASRRAVELCDAQGAVLDHVDLDAFLVRGDVSANLLVSDGQIVHVPARSQNVEIEGEVASPGTYEPRRGEPLRDFLALAGGPLPTADLSRVSVERTDSTGAVRVEIYDLGRDTPNTDHATRITILSTQLGRARVFVVGPDGSQTVLFIAPNESLADLVRRSATVGPEADIHHAQFSTRKADGSQQRRTIDLEQTLRGDESVRLQDGDLLSVPPVKEYVYVSGFVMRPGRYSFRGDWTVNDYVGEAGGPTAGGSLDHAVLLGADGVKHDGNRRSPVQRGETIFLDRSFTGKASGALGLVANLSALIISVVALRR
jgi:protein involved in polysaccharide export with SLBB domain